MINSFKFNFFIAQPNMDNIDQTTQVYVSFLNLVQVQIHLQKL
jgi:hypothetical protein